MVALVGLAVGMVVSHALLFALGYHVYVITLRSGNDNGTVRSAGESSVFRSNKKRQSWKLDPDDIEQIDWEQRGEDDEKR